MRIVNIILGAIMLGFAILHATTTGHDIWVYIYGVTALFCAIAAFHVETYQHGEMFFLLMSGLIAAIIFAWFVIPFDSGLQVTAEWWKGGIERDSLGIGIAIIGMLAALIPAWSMQDD